MKMHAVVISLFVFLALPAALLAQPVIVVEPMALEYDLLTGAVEVCPMTIANPGEELLTWNAEIEYAGDDNELDWLAVDPLQGEIEADMEMDVMATMDATGLDEREYEAEIHFLSNDPRHPDVVVNVQIFLIPAPDIAVELPNEVGDQQMLDFNQLGDVWVDFPAIATLTVRNIGVEELIITDITSDEEHFTVNPVEFELEPGEEMVVDVTFQAEEEGLYDGTLTIISNDPDEEETIIQLRAKAFEPPEMLVNVNSIDLEIEGNEAQGVIEIFNAGRYELRWDATLYQIEGDQFDSTEAIFSVEPQSGSIPRDDAQEVLIKAIFAIEGYFELEFELFIESNDPEQPVWVVGVSIRGTSDVEELPARALPENLTLISINPNPFNSSAVLEFYLPFRSDVTLKVFDLGGREVALVYSGQMEAGKHKQTVECFNLSSGIYIAQIEAGDQVKTAKMVHLE